MVGNLVPRLFPGQQAGDEPPRYGSPLLPTSRPRRQALASSTVADRTVPDRPVHDAPEASGSRRLLRNIAARVAALPMFTKVMIGNAGIVIVGAVLGTYITAYTVQFQPTARPIELAFLFAAIGAGLSVAVNWVVLKAALRPLGGITRTVEEVRKGNLRARVEHDPFSDPQIETLRETLNAMLDRLDEHGARLQALSSQIIKAQEEERLRIARELHDETAQALASLLVRQRVAERSQDPEALQRTMADLRVLTAETLEGVRRMALELRPTMLDDLGLVAAVEAFAKQFSQRPACRSTCGSADAPSACLRRSSWSPSGWCRKRSRTSPATAAPAGPRCCCWASTARWWSASPTTARASSYPPRSTTASAAWDCSACTSGRRWSAAT